MRGTFPDTKPGAVVIIGGFHDDIMPDGFVYNPGMTPAEKRAIR
jgi:hypothetical protein